MNFIFTIFIFIAGVSVGVIFNRKITSKAKAVLSTADKALDDHKRNNE